ncbi:ParB/RepB/Spo0J family partition protein [Paenibacillus tepidiphilus]|uniref:ParB/RepB/Spo0J family partition protein n=1 Tax=Paenibacillus tepidiphilus TaxID=2608683 RepID=UPI0013A549C5|nr:ParB/RepB/Spo0J family partition protein [Paenibacillus tepidiphilus]
MEQLGDYDKNDPYLEWVDIKSVLPNPLNPRKDQSIKTEQMQEILASKGWEEGISCYRKGLYFIILSGHRRWYAAQHMGMKKVPVYVVETPKTDAEAMDRLGSIQGGQVDWTPYEWAKYTYDMWSMSEDNTYSKLSEKMGVSTSLISSRIRVYNFYPRIEVEDKLANGMFSLSMLDYIYSWIKRLEKYHHSIVEDLGIDFIRKQMLRKYENKSINSHIVNDKFFVKQACTQDVFKFITDTNKKLQESQIDLIKMTLSKEKDFIQNNLNLKSIENEVTQIRCGSVKKFV